MSLTFVPKIPAHLRQIAPMDKVKQPRLPVLERKPWSDDDVETLIRLRAIGISYKDCGAILTRSPSTCVTAIAYGDLYARVSTARKKLIDAALYF